MSKWRIYAGDRESVTVEVDGHVVGWWRDGVWRQGEPVQSLDDVIEEARRLVEAHVGRDLDWRVRPSEADLPYDWYIEAES